MTSIEDEGRVAKETQTVISSLTPSTPRTRAQIDTLRKAADFATKAILQNNFSSQKALNTTRGETATALRGLLANGSLTQESISRARNAVEAWLNASTSGVGSH
jgi:hypothetical protein